MTTPPRAAILAIGDEITLGQKTDTNSGAIAQRLIELGVRVTEHGAVPDDQDAIASALARLAGGNNLIFSTGGLGPTPDDLTRQALSDATGSPLVEDEAALNHLREWAQARGRELSKNQRMQALRPEAAEMLRNDFGTAPALVARIGDATVVCLPGPPGEMTPILEHFLNEHIAAGNGGEEAVIRTRIVHVPALAEAEAASRLAGLMDRDRNPLVGTTASGAVVDVRIRYEGTATEAVRSLDETEAQVRGVLDPFALSAGVPSLAHEVVDVLRERRCVLATAESCTGGLIARRMTDIPGSSDVFAGGWVTYSNQMKMQQLGIPKNMLEAHGAVSAQTAQAMATGALECAPGATHSIAVTGIAGPGGGTEEKPVGTVYIACAHAEACTTRRFCFPGDRAAVRSFTAIAALAMLRFVLLGIDPPSLLAQIDNTA